MNMGMKSGSGLLGGPVSAGRRGRLREEGYYYGSAKKVAGLGRARGLKTEQWLVPLSKCDGHVKAQTTFSSLARA